MRGGSERRAGTYEDLLTSLLSTGRDKRRVAVPVEKKPTHQLPDPTARWRKNNVQRFVHDHSQTPPIARKPVAHPPNDLHSHVRVCPRDRVSQLLPVLISPREQALFATHDVLCRLAVEFLVWRRGRGRVGLFKVDSVSFEERLTLGFEVGAVVRPVEVLEDDQGI